MPTMIVVSLSALPVGFTRSAPRVGGDIGMMASVTSGQTYVETAEAAWRWVLGQVQWDSAGPWIPEAGAIDEARPAEPPDLRTGLHSGTGGLVLLLAEVSLLRPWTEDEHGLAQAVAEQVRRRTSTETDASYFDGLVSALTVLLALDEPGADEVVARLLDLVTADGWATPWAGPPTYSASARISDATLGTAGVLLGAAWARRQGVARAAELANVAADILLTEAEDTEHGPRWLFVPRRFRDTPPTEMPGWSHGQAGISAALAVAGAVLDRDDLRTTAHRGAERLVALGNRADGGFVVPRYVPPLATGEDPIAFGWCHGAAGTSQLFSALELAGVADVAGETPRYWQRAAWRSVRSSGVPERLRPGFWDNDGRCCGTAGVGDLALDLWHTSRDEEDLRLAAVMGDALVARARGDGAHRWWQFIEHRAAHPLLDPGTGWMQGATGIAAYLFRLGRVVDQGAERAVLRTDNWWSLPSASAGDR